MITLQYVAPSYEATGSVPIAGLKDRHLGATAYVVGKGRSLSHLTAKDFGPGIIITINQAIAVVDAFGLSQPIYALQKDGCAQFGEICPCATCGPRGWRRDPILNPSPAVTVLFHQLLSPWCLHDRPNRYTYLDADFGHTDIATMSVLDAIALAHHLGASSIVMLCFDHLATGDARYADAYAPTTPAEVDFAQTALDTVKPQALAALQAFGPHTFVVPHAEGS